MTPGLINAFKDIQIPMSSNGLDRLTYISEQRKIQTTKIELAAEAASKHRNSILCLDILQLLVDWGISYSRGGIDISDVHLSTFSLDDDVPDLSRIRFIECIIDSLFVSPNIPSERLPIFERCLIGAIDGVATQGDLPPNAFPGCEIDEFRNSTARNALILETDLPISTKVLLTVLNKLFNQAGRGRRENAFSRGLEPRAKALVAPILDIVASAGFATPARIRQQTIWLPKRDKGRRVNDILNHPNTSQDPLLERVKNL